MIRKSSFLRCLTGAFFIIGIITQSFQTISSAEAKTYVSGKVITADGNVVASGVVALEKGKLHNNAFLTGGAIGTDGTFKIPLPSGGPWGLHVYSEKYIYFPLQIQIKENADNEIPVILPVDGSTGDDPKISNIRFKKVSDQVFQISIQVTDPNNNLGPQMLAIDTKRFRSYRLIPQKGDLKDWKADFPQGEYESPFIPIALDRENIADWLLVAADHQCSNGPVYDGWGQSVFKPPVPHTEKLACDVPGIWKSNFDKVDQFTRAETGALVGEQFEGNLKIEKMKQNGEKLTIDFQFEGKKGQSKLQLFCQDNKITLKGTFKLADKGGDWLFTKLKNAKIADKGEALFNANCTVCHRPDSKEEKVGPGLLGLFKNLKLPASGRPTTEENVRETIKNGGKKMPSFKNLKEEELTAIINYLKEL